MICQSAKRRLRKAPTVNARTSKDHLAASEELVAVLNDLMRAHDEVEIIFVQEIRDDVGAKNVGYAAVVLRPPVASARSKLN